jgi:hypothetical protein
MAMSRCQLIVKPAPQPSVQVRARGFQPLELRSAWHASGVFAHLTCSFGMGGLGSCRAFFHEKEKARQKTRPPALLLARPFDSRQECPGTDRTRARKLVTPILLSIILLLWTLPSWAGNSITATVDKTNVSLGGYFTLTLTVESDAQIVPEPALPALDAFDAYSSGQSQNITWVNGRMSSSVSYTYVLSPKNEGQFTIGPATVRSGGQTFSSAPIVVTVTPARTAPQPQAPSAAPKSAQNAPRSDDRQIFITAELDRETAFVNQPVTYIFRFYQGEPLLANPEYSRPSYPGFWMEDLPPQRKFATVINGVRYDVTEIRTSLFPTDAGIKTIGAADVKATVRSRRRPARRDPFGMFDQDLYNLMDRGESINLSTKSVRLTVLPLPLDGKPADFGGMVGKFTLDVQADVRSVNAGDPITVKVTVTGEGNIKSAPAPRFDSNAAFRSLPAGTSEQISTADYKVSGKKVYEYVFIPQRPGSYRLPSFSISYFDPDSRRYHILQTDSLAVTATGSAADFTIPQLQLNKDQISDLASDVRFLKTDGHSLRRHSDIGFFGWPFWVGHVLPMLGLVGFIAWRRGALRIAADPVGRRRRTAYRTALTHLSKVTDGSAKAIDDVAAALLQYYSDRFNRPASGVLRDEMRDDFTREGVSTSHIGEFLSLLDECDRSRYGRATADNPGVAVANRAKQVLTSLEGLSK